MKTVKRLILLEATFKKHSSYTGTLSSDSVIVHHATELIHLIKTGDK